MRIVGDTDVSGQLRSARELLDQGRTGEARKVIEDVAARCNLLSRSLALRGERVRARMMAGLATELTRIGARESVGVDA